MALVGLQVALVARTLARLRPSTAAQSLLAPVAPPSSERVSVIVPVLDEEERLAPCLDGLSAQGAEVAEILVVDGGSRDGTADLVRRYAARDRRIRLIDASPIPADWNGKPWGLQRGLAASSPLCGWVLTIDADVRPVAGLVAALLNQAATATVAALSVATMQDLHGLGQGLLHPALLTTLVYRLGPPGTATDRVERVQANGQCFLVQRVLLQAVGGFAATRHSRCEDITLARHLAASGHAVGFYEAGALIGVEMYRDWRETWENWPRSLALRDAYWGLAGPLGLVEVTLVQALPLYLIALGALLRRRHPVTGMVMLVVNGTLLALRLGVLAGMRRAYRRPPWTYWLSPLCDLPAAALLWRSALRRRHTWRGRTLLTGGLL